MRKCLITNSFDYDSYYKSVSGKVMTSDQRIINGNLNKIIFRESGIVANEDNFSSEEINSIYADDYTLNTSGYDEHIFYTKEGVISRSQVYFDWIKPFIPVNFETLVEIGCGEGRVLEKIVFEYPQKNILGFDGSHKAVELARKRNLNISQKLIIDNAALPISDVFILIGVIEHLENPNEIINLLMNSLKKNGRIILSIPIQDYGGYDIFFADHIWHFTVNQFESLLQQNGLKLLHVDSEHPINHGFGLFVCEKNTPTNIELQNDSAIQIKNLTFWTEKFIKFDNWLSDKKKLKIAVFGASEIFTLFYSYSSLSDANIIACIDDTKKVGEKKNDIVIYNSQWLFENKIDILLLAVNKKYHEQLYNKFKNLNIIIHPIY